MQDAQVGELRSKRTVCEAQLRTNTPNQVCSGEQRSYTHHKKKKHTEGERGGGIIHTRVRQHFCVVQLDGTVLPW